ncbi:phosphotransferase family protein [Rostrohypoxylon terebratum]|nr:phosphotransferase family protein [Rostrohypoxylon terebratum]
MPPKPRDSCMEKDDIVWRKLDEATEEWDKSIRKADIYRAVVNFILKYKDGPGEQMHRVIKGGYNVIYRLEYKDGSSVIMRVPIKGLVPFSDEKVRYEVATMRYVAANTTIPIPHVYHYGTAAENPTSLGPFIIMDYIDHHQNMSRELLDSTLPIDKHPVLDPNINEEKLEILYAQMANILLQLSMLKFPRIGSLVEGGEKSISVKGRPLTANMTDIIIHTNAPTSVLPEPSRTFDTEDEWCSALADMHMAQLSFQHNDAVEDEDDARDKYVARQLFRNLAKEKRIVPKGSDLNDRFRLFSEDFRPVNVLLDKDLKIVSVIDWEFAYAAPAQFSYDPPWWLLLEEPECWPGGYQAWMEAYEPRLRTFLRVLEAEEKKMADADIAGKMDNLTLADDDKSSKIPLSQRMRESWEKRTWMVSYAARKSWAFDFVWWKFLDEKYFGPNEDQDYKARLELLSQPQRDAIDSFVARKMEELEDGEKVNFGDEDSPDSLYDILV